MPGTASPTSPSRTWPPPCCARCTTRSAPRVSTPRSTTWCSATASDRAAALRAGLGADVPGVTVDRQCGSGLDAVMQAVSRVRAGDDLLLAGGVESASTAPWRFWPPVGDAEPVRYTRAPFAPPEFP